MAMFFGTALFFGIIACTVPYFYAYCSQKSDTSEEITETEENSEIEEDMLVHSLRVKEQKSDSLGIRKTKKMKDVSVNTFETMASDSTSYKRLSSIKENCQEEQKDIFHTASTQTTGALIYPNDFSSSPSRTCRPIKVQAFVHAENPNSEMIAQESSHEGNIFTAPINNLDLLKKRPFFKKEKSTEKLKKFWINIKSRGFSKSSSLEESEKNTPSALPLSSTSDGIKTSTGIISEENNTSTSNLQNQPPLGNSTFRDSKQKLALQFHEVNGSPTIYIESPSGSNNSFAVSVIDLTSPDHLSGSQLQNKTYLIVFQETPCSSYADKDLSEKFSLNRLYKSLPGRFETTGNKVKQCLKRSSSMF